MHTIKKRGLALTQINKLGIISLISSLSSALVATIWAIYLESILKNPSYVGILLTFFTIVAGLSYIFLIPIIEKNSKAKIYLFAVGIFIISYLSFALFSTIWAITITGIILAVATSMKITAFGIILRDKSKNTAVSKNISLIYTFFNISWLIGPIVAGFVANRYGIKNVFFLAAAFMLLTMILFKDFKIKDERKKKRIDKNVLKVLIDFLKNKDRLLIYIISGSVTFWWTLIYIYIPIYIVDSGLNEIIVGYFLALVVVPLILCEYSFGKLTGKIGFKKIFFIGNIALSFFALSCFFIGSIYLILALLILASVFVAMLEPTTEAYFFDLVTKEQKDKYYGPYNTTLDVNNGISLFLCAAVLFFLPFKFIFIFIGICMLFFALLSLKIKNIVESRRK
ncbi:MAG: MFS transporter [archaeon]